MEAAKVEVTAEATVEVMEEVTEEATTRALACRYLLINYDSPLSYFFSVQIIQTFFCFL